MLIQQKPAVSKVQRVSFVMAPALLLGLNLLIFGTFTVFSQNNGEFLIAYTEALNHYYLPALLIFLGACAVPLVLGQGVSRFFSLILFVLAMASYIHGNLLLWNTGILDGNQLDLSRTWRSLIDALIWAALAWLAYRHRCWLSVKGWKICMTLVLFQFISAMLMLFNAPQQEKSGVEEFSEKLSGFSQESNVIHLILDGFQASVFEQLLSAQPGLADEFEGFTFFRDATSTSNVTYLSVPASLSGTAFVNDRSITDYHKQTLRGHNLFSVMAANEYAVDIATPLWWNKSNDAFDSYYRIPTPYADHAEARQSSALLLADLSLYRHAPHFLKHWIYRSGLWLLSSKLVDQPEMQFEHFSHNAFLADLISESSASDIPPRYKFIHLVTPHAPLVTNSSCSFAGTAKDYSSDAFSHQSLCTINNVVAFLSRLKSLDVYDETLLLIHSDHGGGVPFDMQDENGDETNSEEALDQIWGSPLPLVLIKPRFNSGRLAISNQKVQLLDLPATVRSELGLDGSFPGQSMFADQADDNRDRFYYQSRIHRNEAAAKNYFEEFSAYRINGSVYKVESWHGPEAYGAPVNDDATDYRPGDKITFGQDGSSRPFQQTGFGMGATQKITWSVGAETRLKVRLLEINSSVTMRINVKPFLVPGVLEAQEVRVFASDVLVAEWSESSSDFKHHDIALPADVISQSGLTEIRFEFPNAQSPEALGVGSDTRALALAFLSIEFIPEKGPDAR